MLLFAEEKQQAPPSYAYQMVRTDAKERTLDAFVVPKPLPHRSTAVADTSQPGSSEEEHPAQRWVVVPETDRRVSESIQQVMNVRSVLY